MESYHATDVANYSICGKGSERLLTELYGKAVLSIAPENLNAVHALARMAKHGEGDEEAYLLTPYGERKKESFREETMGAASLVANEPAKKVVDHDASTIAMGGKAVIHMGGDVTPPPPQQRSVKKRNPNSRSR